MIIEKPLPKEANRSWIVTVKPAIEPFTVTDLKLFARIDHDDEDTLLSGFITATRSAAKEYINRALLDQTIQLSYEWWPDCAELVRPPLISVTKVETVDEEGVATTYAATNYYVDSHEPARLRIKNGASPPENTDRFSSGFRIEYKAGYGTREIDVPTPIREAIKLWATALYEDRAIMTEPPPQARPMLDMFRVPKL